MLCMMLQPTQLTIPQAANLCQAKKPHTPRVLDPSSLPKFRKKQPECRSECYSSEKRVVPKTSTLTTPTCCKKLTSHLYNKLYQKGLRVSRGRSDTFYFDATGRREGTQKRLAEPPCDAILLVPPRNEAIPLSVVGETGFEPVTPCV
jgi:hypothetical protein